MTPRTKALGKKLYAVLTSYTKGRPLRTISKVPGQNGFEAYRLLVHENMQKSQVRNFHLLQNIINFKSESGKSLNENVLVFEQLIEDYEKISTITIGDEAKLAVIIANAPADVQEHILLNYDDMKSYEDIRDYMLNVEKNKRWTKLTTKEKRQTTTDLIESGQDHGGPASPARTTADGWIRSQPPPNGLLQGSRTHIRGQLLNLAYKWAMVGTLGTQTPTCRTLWAG